MSQLQQSKNQSKILPNKQQNVTTNRFHDIEWYMLDKSKYFPYTILSSVSVRTLLYPLTLVRTRLQVQIQNTVYKGTWDALKTIYQLEGFRALYRSFHVYNLQVIPNVIYITSFEKCREHVTNYTQNAYFRAMIAGGVSSLISQTMVVPIDIVTQHMMLIGQKPSLNAQTVNKQAAQLDRMHISSEAKKSNILMLKEICRKIYTTDKIFGFYRGYLLSSILMSTNSAFWWMFYYIYQGIMI
jgi:solute carrier family 25 protein 44